MSTEDPIPPGLGLVQGARRNANQIAASLDKVLMDAADQTAERIRQTLDRQTDRLLSAQPDECTAAEILALSAETYRERNKVYGDNFKNVAPVMREMFPKGILSEVTLSEHFHLFELLVVKLTRFANSGLTHVDSIHDAVVYAAMIEASITKGKS